MKKMQCRHIASLAALSLTFIGIDSLPAYAENNLKASAPVPTSTAVLTSTPDATIPVPITATHPPVTTIVHPPEHLAQTGSVSPQCNSLPTDTEREHCWGKQQAIATSAKEPLLAASHSEHPGDVRTINNPYQQQQYYRLPFITVSTSPYIGELTAFNASDVLNQAGKINEDLLLLQTRQQLIHTLEDANLQLTRPILEISGGIAGQFVEASGFEDDATSGDIALDTAELDFHAIASDWASGFLAFSYDSSPSSVTGTRTPNSRVFLSRGFVNIGNLDVTPVYFTIGQMYIPFGRYSSDIFTTPVTQSLARTNDRAAVLGYYNNGFNASIYSYPGDDENGGTFVFKQGGANISYKHAFHPLAVLSGGLGVESNLTDSDGLQNTGRGDDDEFSGFATDTGSNDIKHRVPAGDIHAEGVYHRWNFAAEYISALSEAAESDLEFNDDGARPQAMHLEAENKFFIGELAFHGLLAYDHTWQALGANLPEQSVIAHLHTSFWKNTVEGIEYRYDADYGHSDTANGSTDEHPDNDTIEGTGRCRNTILVQVGVYF